MGQIFDPEGAARSYFEAEMGCLTYGKMPVPPKELCVSAGAGHSEAFLLLRAWAFGWRRRAARAWRLGASERLLFRAKRLHSGACCV